jgi:hypothetical protein
MFENRIYNLFEVDVVARSRLIHDPIRTGRRASFGLLAHLPANFGSTLPRINFTVALQRSLMIMFANFMYWNWRWYEDIDKKSPLQH